MRQHVGGFRHHLNYYFVVFWGGLFPGVTSQVCSVVENGPDGGLKLCKDFLGCSLGDKHGESRIEPGAGSWVEKKRGGGGYRGAAAARGQASQGTGQPGGDPARLKIARWSGARWNKH